MSVFTFTVLPDITLTNDFIARRDVLEALSAPLLLFSTSGRLLWANGPGQTYRLTETEIQQIAERILQKRRVGGDGIFRPNRGFVAFRILPLYNLEGALEAFLVELDVSLAPHAMDRLETGILLARDRKILYQNPAMTSLIHHNHSGSSWEECSQLPDWTQVAEASFFGNFSFEADGVEYRFFRAPPFVVVEGRPPLDPSRQVVDSGLAAQLVHEIRNPLAAIAGYVEMALTRSTDDTIYNWLEEARNEVDRLSRLTEDLLYFTRPIHLRPRPVKLEDLVQRAWNMVDPALVGSVRLEFRGENPTLQVDTDRFHQVLLNLFKNAVEALDRDDGLVEVQGSTDAAGVCILIRDNGPGISPAMLQNWGKRIQSSKPGGTGLGLLVSRTLIEAHRGTATVESDHRGTTVTIRLPAGNESRPG